MTFTTKEIYEFLEGKDDVSLYQIARLIKEELYENKIFLRAIIETNNICPRNCLYCGLRIDNKKLTRYALKKDIILKLISKISKLKIRSLVLQGGQIISKDEISFVEDLLLSIKRHFDMDITLSYGDLDRETYKRFKLAGADRYLLKIETMQRDLFEIVSPKVNFKKRLKCIDDLLDLSYQVGSGFIAGLPGYDNFSFAKDLKEISKLGIHMFSVSPFISTSHTPFENERSADANLVYRSIALYRIFSPKVNIPVTSALGVLDKKAYEFGPIRGANVLMISFTPKSFAKNYFIFNGKNETNFSPQERIFKIKKQIEARNLTLVMNNIGRSLYANGP